MIFEEYSDIVENDILTKQRFLDVSRFLYSRGLAGMHLTSVWKVMGSIPIWNSDFRGVGGGGSSLHKKVTRVKPLRAEKRTSYKLKPHRLLRPGVKLRPY